MRYKTEQSLHSAVKLGELYGAYLMMGTEPYLLAKQAKLLTEAWVGKEPGPFAVERFDGGKPDFDQIYTALTAVTMLRDKKVVLLVDFPADKQKKEDLEKIKTLLDERSEDTLFLVTAGESGKSAKAIGVVSAFEKVGAVVELGPKTTGDLVKFLQARAKELGCGLSADLGRYIIESCGTDMLLLEQEVRKVCSYVGSGDITREQADRVLSPKVEARIFDLSKRILSGNYQQAMEILDALLYLKEAPVTILSVLSMAYLDLYRAKAAKQDGKAVGDMVRDFDYKGKDFRPRNALGLESRLSGQGLSDAVLLLADCDRQLKSSRVDDRVLLEQTITRLIACR